ncbi:MAG: ComEC/Rec2 family competence protein, partial [Acidobacteria bacterium]|nr:ComEC/Rec2 family competence protein [Acidobacteriota bacterium]
MTKDDQTPAALPLICYACALACGASLVAPRWSAVGIVIAALLLRRRLWIIGALAIAGGLFVATRTVPRPSFPEERFTRIEAPLDRDWSHRGGTAMLRVASFRANGIDFDQPLLVYTHASPPPIGLAAFLEAEGFVRANERGDLTMTVKSARLLAYRGELRWWQPSRWNRAIAMRLAKHARRWPEEVAMAEALALGRGELLEDETRDEFRRGGTYHLLVFSGMQIAFAAAAIAWLVRWFLHKPRVSDWLLLAMAILAPLFIGATASVVRASIAIGLYAVSRLLGRPTSLANLWCVSALFRLLVAPQDLADPAFHLTYAGAGALLFLGQRKWLQSALAVEASITPLTLWHFRQYAIAGAAMTLVLSPIV